MSVVGSGGIQCSECGRDVDEFTAIAERWLYYSDGCDLYPYCPPYAKREFADDAPASGRWPPRSASWHH